MFCTNCGKQLDDGLKFCTTCGTPVAQNESASAPVEQPTVVISAEAASASVLNQTADLASTVALDPTLEQEPAQTTVIVSAAAPVSDQASIPTPAQAQAQVSASTPIQNPQVTQAYPQSFNAVPTDQAPANQVPANNPQTKKKSKAPLIVAIVVVLAIIAAIVAAYFIVIKPAQDEAQLAAEKAAMVADVSFEFSGDGYVASTFTPIAVSVQGSTFDNESYDETYFIKGSETIELPYGNYTATPLGSPMSSDGSIFNIAPESVEFTISQSGVSKSPSFQMSKVAAIDVTDAQIQAAVDAAQLADVSSNEITTLRQTIEKARSDALEAKRKADEAKAAEDAKKYMTVVNCKEWISLRVSPSTSAERVTTIPLGERVEYLGVSTNGFAKISWHGMEGWSLLSYLS